MPAGRSALGLFACAVLLLPAACAGGGGGPSRDFAPSEAPAFRAPAFPLFVQTPYLNIWLCGDRLADDSPKLWNGAVKGMAGMLKIDGRAYRFLGLPGSPLPSLRQDSARVLPTRTEFLFSQDDVALRLEFLSPADPRDLELLALPVGYLRAEIACARPRRIELYLDLTAEWAVGSSDRRVTWDGRFRLRPSQPRLFRETHNWPDWGEVHWAALDEPAASYVGPAQDLRRAFAEGKPPDRDARFPRAASDGWPAFAHVWELGSVKEPVTRRALVALTRREAALFYGDVCPAAWTRRFPDGEALVRFASSAAEEIRARAARVDAEVLARARAAGGEPLAALAALAFRQALAAGEPVRHGDRTYVLSKSLEIGGPSPVQSLETLYVASPLALAFNPDLLRMHIEPILEAVRRGFWRERFAPRDLGTYPLATGPSAPSEPGLDATAALLLLATAAGRHDPEFAREYAAVLRKMADFLHDALSSPQAAPSAVVPEGDAGPVLRAILALACFPELRSRAEALLRDWTTRARAEVHTARALNDPSGWSLKPDLFADRMLGLHFFPSDWGPREAAFARARSGRFGAPADHLKNQARADALLWIAGLAPRDGREALAADLLRLYSETPTRVPPAERYETDSGRQTGTPARPALGAVFAPVLAAEREGR
ncbi:MAG TPA: DUF5127 domain-containing protein [Planctomycetota bacterium]|nr:DUF5127 domain-containing protein [Planctomycetota bacterium]